MRHIVVIEDEALWMRFILRDLNRLLGSDLKVTQFGNLSDFLVGFKTLESVDLFVTDLNIPLCAPNDDVTKSVDDFYRRFPEIPDTSNGKKSGEAIIRWLRSNGVNTPIILHTNYRLLALPTDLFSELKATYCSKGGQDLFNAVCKVFQIPIL